MTQLVRRLALAGLLLFCPAMVVGQHAGVLSPGEETLNEGDVLKVSIWREPDLSGEFQIDEYGVVTLPLLGKKNVLHKSISEIRDGLIVEYAVQLRNPSITITPLRRVYVLGEVAKPGLYAVDPTITLAGIVAIAGGATPNGSIERLRILRGGKEVLKRVPVGSSLASVNIRSEDQIFVDRRSWLDRNNGAIVSSGLSVAATILVTLLLRR